MRGGDLVVPILSTEIRRATAAGVPVIYTQDWHPPSTPHFAKDGGIWPVHCVGDTWGAAFHPDLLVAGPSVLKGVEGEDGYSGFSVRDPHSGDTQRTELEHVLRERGVERLVIGGLTTDYCVKETTLDGRRLGFAVTVLTDAIAAVELEAGDGAQALDAMAAAGAILTTAGDGS